MFFCVININAHGLHRLSYFKWFSHFIDRSKLTQIPNGYTCDVIPFLKTHNNDILHLPCVYNTPPSKFHIKILKGQITYSASFVRLSFYCLHVRSAYHSQYPPPEQFGSTWQLIMFIIWIKILTIAMSTISIGTSFLNLYGR